jgi:hypothetical protein
VCLAAASGSCVLCQHAFRMFRRRRPIHTPLLLPPSTAQVRRDNVILIGAGTMIILAGLPVGLV